MLFYDYFHYEKFPNIPVSLVSELHNYNTRTALQAHFFKKSPFGDLKLQNGRQKKNNNNKCNIQGRTLRVRYMNFYYAERHVCNPFLCQIVTFTRLPIKTL